MRRTAFSIALAAEMFVIAGSAQAQPAQPGSQPAGQPSDVQPAARRDPAERERLEKEWKDVKKEWEKLTDEQRVLSAIRATNRMEIEAARIATTRATSQSVKDFAAMMIRDHTDADTKLSSLAAAENITLWDTTRTDRVIFLKKMFEKDKAHKDKDKDKDRDRKETDKERKDKDHDGMKHGDMDDPANWSESVRQMHENPLAWLNAQPAEQFDRIYGHMMHMGHTHVLAMLDKKRDDLKNERVKAYVNEVTVAVRKHMEEASKLPGAGEGIKRDDTKIYPPGNKPADTTPPKNR